MIKKFGEIPMGQAYCQVSNLGGTVAFTDDFKARLNIAFGKAGLTKRKFAQLCGVSAPTATKWLDTADSLTPILQKIPLIARVLNVTSGYLIDGDPKGAPDNRKAAKAKKLAAEIVKLLDD
jgi:transcriptional regulator with XRE-family HTH domain